jgi:hypothetical protein
MGIHMRRVLIGGLVAGITIILISFAMIPVVGKEMEMALARFNLPPLSGSAMAFFAVESLILGMILVWLYAAMLPRLKQGIKTAIVSASVVWLLAYFFANFAMVVYGFMPLRLTIIGTAWGLFELLAASLIGSRFYREKVSR